MREVILTQEQLEERLTYWKEKLRLRDWIIKVLKANVGVLGSRVAGRVTTLHCNKVARILILHEDYYPSVEESGITLQGQKATLVHELLHLHTRLINKLNDEGEHDYCMFKEQAIESIVSGLIALERG